MPTEVQKKDIWTTPDKFKTKKEAIDKLDLFKAS
ncbi:hypothetical protein BSPWISOXPB_6171 [uncultured Gammaproteobacteria bacterium]|nr:hypothetical protein BSPWISOXPB_6171 [uncultured Gammaproteobacteria bacterium]